MNKATQEFIQLHSQEYIHSLVLQTSRYPEVDMQFAIRQITGKQKTRHKIPTFFECENLLYPIKLSLEQSSSEITAKHKSVSCEGKVLIDLTGGFGVDSYFFSFRFEKVFYVERQLELCELAKHNFEALNRHNIDVINEQAEDFLEKIDYVDWIYLDPARRTDTGKKAVLLSDCEPDVAALAEKLLSKCDNVMIKLSPMIDLVHLTKELPDLAEIQVVAVENECKEVIAILRKNNTEPIKIRTSNYPNDNPVEYFDFEVTEEMTSNSDFTSEIYSYLYEPNVAVMKSGAFKLTGERFQLFKLHINSHLYTSEKFILDFPGRIFQINRVYDFGKSSLKDFRTEIQKANLSIRNFPTTVSELRKKLKLAEGGDIYVFATILNNGKKVLISCNKAK